MPLNGSGTYALPSPEYPAVSGTTIVAADFNTIMQDIATALSTAFYRDGQVAFSTDLPLGGNKITGVADGEAATDAVNKSQLDAITAGTPPEFVTGTAIVFFQATAPTGWTQSIAHNDKALRIVSGTGGGSGGTDNLSTPPSTAHTHTMGDHSHTVASHTHSVTTPVHSHAIFFDSGTTTSVWGSTGSSATITSASRSGASIAVSNTGTYPTGFGSLNVSCYTQTVILNDAGSTSGASAPSTSTASGASSGSTSPTAFAPKYVDVIVGVKN